MSITISSGHGKYVSGASDIVNEVTEARRITNEIARLLKSSMAVNVHHDDTSRDQRTNVNTIIAAHNKTIRNADYSVHLNASGGRVQTDMGVEVLYYSDSARGHAQALSDAISAVTGLKNRGAKKRTDLGFLKGTNKPAFLIEAYFVNSVADVAKMKSDAQVTAFADAVAKTICAHQGVVYKGGVNVSAAESNNKAEIIIDGKRIDDGLIIDGRTYAPIRATAEAFGASLVWDNVAKKATITTK